MMMFSIPYNTTLVIVGAIVLAVVGFVIYGFIKGWENVFRECERRVDRSHEGSSPLGSDCPNPVALDGNALNPRRRWRRK